MRRTTLLALAGLAVMASCKKTEDAVNPGTPTSETTLAPEGFNFSTTKNVSLNVRLLTNDDQPLKGVLVDVYGTSNFETPLFKALSNEQGIIEASISVPASTDTLVIDPAYVGLMRNAVAVIKNNSVTGVIGGASVYSGDIIANEDPATGSGIVRRSGIEGKTGTNGTTVFSYLSTYDNNGRPSTFAPSDVISSELLTYINTSLPETKPVPTFHPDYLTANAETNLNIEKLADVWITFVHEGAGYLNTLGYYTYPTNRPPQTQAEIDSIKIVLPNASLSGSGGSLRSGDKVLLGRFQPGVSVGFVLLQNAWSSTSKTVNTGARKYFSDDALNVENAGFKRHTVLLYDDKHKLFLNGFEDLQRDNNSSDNDFNDLIFYATSNPVEAISIRDVNPVDKPTDTDGDGVTDTYDKFPADPTKAYIQYFPSADTYGTLAFEDLWPSSGDYDINDLVVGYQYKLINNAQNKTVEMDGAYTIYGIGASRKNGFGVQLPVSPDKVSAITGQKIVSNYVTRSGNGTEAGQTKAVFFPFDDPQALIAPAVFVNNVNGRAHVKSDTARINVKFTTALTATELGAVPFNPFLVGNQQRGYEVHLPGNKPTDKADKKHFSTYSDKTNPAINKYYLTGDNWPWALHFPEKFEYPTESSHITKVYTYFLPWAKSGGISNTDWYTNKNSYRNSALIYKPQ